MEASSYIKASHTKRFVVEDSITKVTSDGQPHEMMTMIAGLSGLLAAFAILAILISLVVCKKNQSEHNCEHCSNENLDKLAPSNRSSLSTVYTRAGSLPESTSGVHQTRLVSVSTISSGHLEGILNCAFHGSELSLNDSLRKKKKKSTRWSDAVEEQPGTSKETALNIENL